MRRLSTLLIAALSLSCVSVSDSAPPVATVESPRGVVTHLNPEGLHRNPAYTQVVTVTGPAKLIFVGGQNGVDAEGNIVGKGDLRLQTEQAFTNLETALGAAGAKLENVVKWNVYVVAGNDPRVGHEVFQRRWGNRPNAPTITVVFVSALAHRDFLIEIDAIAALP